MAAYFRNLLFAIFGTIIVFAMLSCSHLDAPESACGGLMEFDADTVAICFSDSAVAFAGSRETPSRFNLDAYLLREYNVARDEETTQASSPYPLSFVQWRQLGWESRRAYLPFPYSHDIVGAGDAEFLYLIATYPEQFSFGWRDTYRDSIVVTNPPQGHIWYSDDPETIQFDGYSADYNSYMDLLIYLR